MQSWPARLFNPSDPNPATEFRPRAVPQRTTCSSISKSSFQSFPSCRQYHDEIARLTGGIVLTSFRTSIPLGPVPCTTLSRPAKLRHPSDSKPTVTTNSSHFEDTKVLSPKEIGGITKYNPAVYPSAFRSITHLHLPGTGGIVHLAQIFLGGV